MSPKIPLKSGLAIALFIAVALIAACGDDGAGPVVIQIGEVVITVEPTDATAGVALSPGVRVELRDADGNLIASATDSVTAAIADNPAGGTLLGTTRVAAANGVATFSDLVIERAGAGYTLEVSVGSVTDTSAAFAISAAAASQLAFTSQPTSGTARMTLGSFVVEVQDEFGNSITTATDDITVAFEDNPGSMIFHAFEELPVHYNLVDPVTPALFDTLPDSPNIDELTALAYDPGSGMVLGAERIPGAAPAPNARPGAAGGLNAIDTSDGTTTLIGNIGVQLRGLEFETPGGRLLGLASFENELYEIDPSTAAPTLLDSISGPTIEGFNGLARDPTDGQIYAVKRAAPGRTRELIVMDVGTFSATEIGTLSEDGVAGIAFLADGTMLGVTGDGATNPAMLWTVDKSTAAMTLIIDMASDVDCCGEAITSIPAVLSGTLTLAAVSGAATFDDLEINAPADGYTLVASAAGLSPGISGAFNIVSP